MKKNKLNYFRNLGILILLCTFIGAFTTVNSREQKSITLTLHDVEISEAMEMLSVKERVNIVLAKDVTGTVSINLYDVSLRQAILSIADAAGYAVELRNGSYFILKREESGKYARSGLTELRTFKVEYSDSDVVEQILETYLSEYGKITNLSERKLLVVEDLPSFIDRIEDILTEIDKKPKQIFIEAKILEITLRDSESFGLDWAKFFSSDDGDGIFGVDGLSNPLSPGFFFELVTPNIAVFLDTLFTRGRLRTLSTPKLLALENQEAEVVIGDRLGFRVTTTINQVTSETIEFLESGVILRVKPTVDGQGRILLDIHPEVSTGRVEDGIPNQVTTEVTTQMLVEDGQTVFIGGLIRRSTDQNKEGVPVLGDIPVLGRAFSNKATNSTNTETVVMITPYIVDDHNNVRNAQEKARALRIENELENKANDVDQKLNKYSGVKSTGSNTESRVNKEIEASDTAQNSLTSVNCRSNQPANLSAVQCF